MVSCRRIGTLLLIVGFAVLQQLSASAQSSHPLTGTWKLNLAKSKYSPANLAPKSGSVVKFQVKGDTITRQGDVAHWPYIIDSGQAEVVVESPAGRRPIATLMGGSVFGEMGMMTGEPRRATVVARTDVECYRLDKEGFESVMRARPLPSIITFAGLRSRWMTPRSCAAARPAHSRRAISRALSRGRRPMRRRSVARSSPSMYSIERNA